MIIAHQDSHGNDWFFRFAADRSTCQRIARKLLNRAVRVEGAKNSAERARALLAEAVLIADYQAYNGATVEDWNAAPESERFLI